MDDFIELIGELIIEFVLELFESVGEHFEWSWRFWRGVLLLAGGLLGTALCVAWLVCR